ncbi:MAG: Bis-ABC ATPase YheS [Candidatus Burkholderia crenata]|nr:MAG: Bis-ABC ATPase YheS [Candidatus Burkholderia crenata]
MKALERMEIIAPAHASSPFTFEFRTPDAAPNPMMVMDAVRCGITRMRVKCRSWKVSRYPSRTASE